MTESLDPVAVIPIYLSDMERGVAELGQAEHPGCCLSRTNQRHRHVFLDTDLRAQDARRHLPRAARSA